MDQKVEGIKNGPQIRRSKRRVPSSHQGRIDVDIAAVAHYPVIQTRGAVKLELREGRREGARELE